MTFNVLQCHQKWHVAAYSSGSRGCGGGRGTLRPAADDIWRPEIELPSFPGPDSYALLFLL